jgi:hypothetical protein
VDEKQDWRCRGVEGGGVAAQAEPVALGASQDASPGSLESFLEDRQAEHWYAGEPVIPGEPVSAAIARFTPSSVPDEVWSRIGVFVSTSVEQATPHTVTTAMTLMTIVTQLVVWTDRLGLPVEASVVFHPGTIDRFAVEGCAHLRPGTQQNYRTWLRDVGQVLCPDLYPPRQLVLPRSDPLVPYSPSDVTALLAWSRGLPSERYRHNSSVLLAFGFGAGLTSQEISRLVGTDVTIDDDGVMVTVIGPKARRVPVLERFEHQVESLASEAGSGPIFLPERRGITKRQIPNFIARCPRGDGPRLNMNRLRATWIVHHLSAGTQLGALADAAGVDPSQLVRYQPYALALDPAERRRQLREAAEP